MNGYVVVSSVRLT